MPAPKSEVHLTGKQRKERQFGFMLATGRTQVEAYSAVFNVQGLSKDVIEKRASRLSLKPGVVESGRTFLREQKIADLDSAGECVQDLLNDIKVARKAENWTAVSSLTRLRGQMHGVLRDVHVVTPEAALSDDQIVQRLAKNDPKVAAHLRVLVGSCDDYSE